MSQSFVDRDLLLDRSRSIVKALLRTEFFITRYYDTLAQMTLEDQTLLYSNHLEMSDELFETSSEVELAPSLVGHRSRRQYSQEATPNFGRNRSLDESDSSLSTSSSSSCSLSRNIGGTESAHFPGHAHPGSHCSNWKEVYSHVSNDTNLEAETDRPHLPRDILADI
eukprot:GILK01014681.1.p1 GENE.GILK01014681.1~~GILK01014681.1.p1  ORF type:complete len:167 (-),score=15.76 GILK01014681.1:168-668(-)